MLASYCFAAEYLIKVWYFPRRPHGEETNTYKKCKKNWVTTVSYCVSRSLRKLHQCVATSILNISCEADDMTLYPRKRKNKQATAFEKPQAFS